MKLHFSDYVASAIDLDLQNGRSAGSEKRKV